MLRKDDLARIKLPLLLVAGIALIASLQLVPLPPDLWTLLPEHEAIARLDNLLGLEVWRPVTLSSAATINALGSLTVPLAALLLFSMVRDHTPVLLGFVAIGIVSALLGIMQLFADPRSGLFFYEITNNGSAVGLFANRNHHAVFLACCLLVSLFLMQHSDERRFPWIKWSMAAAGAFLALAIITNASRAGIIALCMSLFLGALTLGIDRLKTRKTSAAARQGKFLPILLAVVAIILLPLFALAERSPALARILENSALEDLRAKLLPILLDMVGDFQPWGSGLGAFEYAYRMREPVDLLGPAYVNEAHNDWLQFPIETGVPGLILFALLAVICVRRFIRLPYERGARSEPWLGLGILIVLGAASVVDYPLRVPSVMVLAVIALAMFGAPALKGKSPEVSV
ncbi:hypothetical protein GRI69_04435 [Erythrobacter vulgaris]|uniref:O-antigen ligase-related domain-containing protein n=1 Tax=Qipengyuania vulgaris TaxID=291985 RepID=A0A844XQP2_9SPHN|nr:O-antigen ligase family protein [Qipengyuania vulgaris]MXO47503.1 hypothetical protein [Qipengyuania vulgaris]